MALTEESFWLPQYRVHIRLTHQIEGQMAHMAYFCQKEGRTKARCDLTLSEPLPSFQTDRPYSHWINCYSTPDYFYQDAVAASSLQAGYRLGGVIKEKAMEAHEWGEDIEFIPIRPYNRYVVAKKGTLADYLPFEQLEELLQQAAIHYPTSVTLKEWSHYRLTLEQEWGETSIATWVRLITGGLKDGLAPHQFILGLIEGIPLERLL